MKRQEILNLQELQSLPLNQKIQLASKLSKRANTRLTALEKKDLAKNSRAYKLAMLELDQKKRYYQGKKYETENLVNIQLAKVVEFLNKTSSTLEGARKAKANQEEYIRKFEIETDIDLTGHLDDFFDFLNGEMFENLRHLKDSNQIVEDLALMLEEGKTINQIESKFYNYLDAKGKLDYKDQKRKMKKLKKEGKLLV